MRLWLADRQVDLVTRDVTRAGHTAIRLTTKEADLLGYLAGRAGEEVPRGDLLGDVWGYAPTAKTRAVDFTVRRLRQKIEVDPKEPAHVVTVHGVGYRFDPGEAPPDEGAPAQPAPTELEVAPPETATIGRDAERRMITQAFAGGARMVTLLGPVGVGKSHLARSVAAEAGPAIWVGCGSDPAGDLARSLALPDDELHRMGPALRRLGPVLLVLDGIEEPDERLLHGLGACLRAAPALRLLVTARERLGIGGEHVLALGGLSPAAARELIRVSGRDEPVPVEAITRLDGLPLALVLAARSGLTAASGDGAILGALDGAWARLDEGLRGAWARLAVCADGVDLDGAECLLDDPAAVDVLERLQDRGLLRAEDGPTGLRFRLLASVRRYGLQRLGGDRGAVFDRRVAWITERAWPVVEGGEDPTVEVQAALLADSADLRVAWERGGHDPQAAVRAAVLLAVVGARPGADLARAEAADELVEDDDVRLVLRRWRARLRLRRGDAEGALADAAAAVSLARSRGRRLHQAHSGRDLAHALRLLGRLPEAGEAARHAAETFAEAGREGLAGAALCQLGQVEHELGHLAEAEAVLREAIHRARLSDRPLDRAEALVTLGTLLRHRKRLAAAHDAYREASEAIAGVAERGEQQADPRLEALSARLDLERAILDLEEGHPGAAMAALDVAFEALSRRGRVRDAAEAGLARASVLWRSGQVDEAVELLADVREGFGRTGDVLYSGLANAWSAAAAAALGELDDARAWLAAAESMLEPLGLSRGTQVLRAARAHLDLAGGCPVDEALAWSDTLERSDDAWGDVRQVLRMLRQTLEVRDAQ